MPFPLKANRSWREEQLQTGAKSPNGAILCALSGFNYFRGKHARHFPFGFSFVSSVAAWRCFSSQLAKLGQLQVAFSFLIVKQFANHMQFQLLLLLLLLLTDFCHTPNCRLLLFSPRPSVGHLAVVIAAFPVYYMIINEMPQLWPRHKGKEQKITETETETNQRTNPGIPTYDLHTHTSTHTHIHPCRTQKVAGQKGGSNLNCCFAC